MKKGNYLYLLLLMFNLIFISDKISAQRFTFSPTLRLGVLITPPTYSELGYNTDDNFKMNPFNYGIGLQGLFGIGSTSTIKLGLELGFKKVFSATETLDNTDIGLGYSENIDKEHAINIHVIFDKAFGEKFHFQAGVGPHLTLWTWTYDYTGPSTTHSEDGGVGVNFGFMTSGVIYLLKSEHFNIPLALRLDCTVRYGVLLSPTISTGILF